ncbi:insertion sequence IS6100 (plasmid) [Novosphingobium sp. PP1Y]|nr:insertion sequence IS6100 [Novosphingobium sp. PP1Y]
MLVEQFHGFGQGAGPCPESVRSFGTARRRKVEIDRVAPLVDRPVQVDPLAPNLDVGFIQAPTRIEAAPSEPAQTLFHFWRIALNPAIDRRMIDLNAAFRQYFLKIAVADRIATISTNRL